MNHLSIQKKVQIVNLLVEGNSMRSIMRILDVSKGAVAKLLVEVGRACMAFHNDTVINVKASKIQADEIWAYVGCKDKNATDEQKDSGMGDAWTWVGIDADTKLVVSWFVGNRSAESATIFMQDMASRLSNRVQLTTDGHHAYLEGVTDAFGSYIDYAQLIKIYGSSSDSSSPTERKYSPSKLKSIEKHLVSGKPDKEHISTSYVERQNLTMRMHMRRFTRLTNGFSKKLENHMHAIALHFVYYNFVKQHNSLRITPAMAAGLTKRFMTLEDIVTMIPERKPNRPLSYKKKAA